MPSGRITTHPIEFYKLHAWSIEYLEYTGRKSVMLTMFAEGKAIFLGYRELLGRQQLMQDCVVGVAGLCDQTQLEEVAVCSHQPISTERVRRQMVQFYYSCGLGPVLATSKSYFEGTSARRAARRPIFWWPRNKLADLNLPHKSQEKCVPRGVSKVDNELSDPWT